MGRGHGGGAAALSGRRGAGRAGVVVHPMRLATNERPPHVPGGARSPRPLSNRASDARIDAGRAASRLGTRRPTRMFVAARTGCTPLSGRGSGPRYVRPSAPAPVRAAACCARSGVVVHPMRLATNERPPHVPRGARSPRPVANVHPMRGSTPEGPRRRSGRRRPTGMSVAARIGCTPLSGRAILNVRGSATTIAVPVPGSAAGHDEAGRGLCRAPGREWRGGATCPSC